MTDVKRVFICTAAGCGWQQIQYQSTASFERSAPNHPLPAGVEVISVDSVWCSTCSGPPKANLERWVRGIEQLEQTWRPVPGGLEAALQRTAAAYRRNHPFFAAQAEVPPPVNESLKRICNA